MNLNNNENKNNLIINYYNTYSYLEDYKYLYEYLLKIKILI